MRCGVSERTWISLGHGLVDPGGGVLLANSGDWGRDSVLDTARVDSVAKTALFHAHSLLSSPYRDGAVVLITKRNATKNSHDLSEAA